MGEVYRARDTRLRRDVAIKVLPPDKLSDPARRARFEQEARAVAALNHPHIVTIHEIESAEGTDFIVMELVPGKTLDAVIPRQGMRLGEALRVAIPLADALAAAHAAAIVHRDLKPGNVTVTPDGVVKVLDFGLAKLTQAEEAGGEDATTLDAQARLSRPGTVAGTPAYMSPEQAAGGVVDARSDIFSFGAVLYEMVTGHRPFGGASSAEILAALLKEQPKPPSEFVPDVPRDLERLIVRCLLKEPERRFQSILDVKVELQEVKEESDSQAAAAAGVVRGPTRRTLLRWLPVLVAVALVTSVLIGLGVRWRFRPVPALSVVRSVIKLEPGYCLDGTRVPPPWGFDRPTRTAMALFRNGRPWVYDLGRGTASPLTREGKVWNITWTPDGRRVVFNWSKVGSGFALYWQPADGSSPMERLTTSDNNQWLGSFSPDGATLAFVEDRPDTGADILLLDPKSRRVTPFLSSKANEMDPTFSPDGRWLAYVSDESGRWETYVKPFPAPGGKRQISSEGGSEPLWARTGKQLFYRSWDPHQAVWVVDVRADGDFLASRPRLLFEAPGFQGGVPRCWDMSLDGQRFLMVKIDERKAAPLTEMVLVENWFEELERLAPAGKN